MTQAWEGGAGASATGQSTAEMRMALNAIASTAERLDDITSTVQGQLDTLAPQYQGEPARIFMSVMQRWHEDSDEAVRLLTEIHDILSGNVNRRDAMNQEHAGAANRLAALLNF